MGAVGAHQSAQQQADYNNAVAARDYKYAVARREGEWNRTLSVWGNKKVDYENEFSENHAAAGRSYAAEQYKMNEMFQQAAFQKQDMLAQLVNTTGGIAASERLGKTAQRLDTAALAAFGRNNAIIAENLASARAASIQRNEDIRQQMMSANNKAWSQVAIAPTAGTPPPPPIMQQGPSGLGLAAGILGGIATGAGGFMKAKAPDAGNFNSTGWAGQTMAGKQLPSNTPQLVPTPPINGPTFPDGSKWTNNWGGNTFNYNSRNYLT